MYSAVAREQKHGRINYLKVPKLMMQKQPQCQSQLGFIGNQHMNQSVAHVTSDQDFQPPRPHSSFANQQLSHFFSQ
jgi:hypothetical protein